MAFQAVDSAGAAIKRIASGRFASGGCVDGFAQGVHQAVDFGLGGDEGWRQRNAITGLFIQWNDYQEMKAKNFWRIVGESNISEWQKSHDNNLAKIFNGSEFNRIILPKKAAASAE